MKRQASVKLNMIMNAILTMSAFIFPLITFPYISRILLPAGTGRVNFATSVVTYFSMFAQLGIPTYGVRICASVRDDKEKLSRTVQELLIINISMCVLVYIVFILCLILVPRFRRDIWLFLVLGLLIGLNAIGVEWLYKALEKYSYITIRSVIFKFIALIAMFLLVHQESDYVIYGGISIFAASASNVLNFVNLHKYITLKPTGNYHFRKHLKMALIFFSMSVATTIYTNLDTVMLGFMKGDEETGFYGAAVKIKSILVSLVTSVSAVLLPRASYYVEKGQFDEFYRILRKAMHFVLILAAPFALYFMFYAKEGILFLSGEAFEPAILPMQIIMPTLILIGMTNVIGIQMLVPLGKEKQVLYSEIAGAITDLILNIILIPRFASSGAAFGTLMAEIVVLLWQLWVIRGTEAKLYVEVPWGKMLIALIAGTVMCLWAKYVFSNTFLILVSSAVCFFGAYGAVLLFAHDTLVFEVLETIRRKIVRKR